MSNKSNTLRKYYTGSPAATSEIRESVIKSEKSTLDKRNRYLSDKLDYHRRITPISYYRSKKKALRDRDELLELQEIDFNC